MSDLFATFLVLTEARDTEEGKMASLFPVSSL